MYLLVECGFEGIEDLIYLSDNKELILTEHKKAIEKKIKKAEEMIEWEKKEFPQFKPWKINKQEIADRFCVNKWDVTAEEKFECVCKELGIKTKELVLY